MRSILRSARSIKTILPPQKPEDFGKLTVVLDIDETLIHSNLKGALKDVKNNSEIDQKEVDDNFLYPDRCQIKLDGYSVNVHRRPFLDWFLKEASSKFELITFTAGVEDYGSKVLALVDPTGELIRHRLYRHHCTQLDYQLYAKDLRTVNRPLNRVVLVDNNPMCFLLQPENGIPVNSFYDQLHDATFPNLMNLLDRLNGLQDVRPFLKESFGLPEILAPYSKEISERPKVETTTTAKAML